MLHAVLNKFWLQNPTKQQLYNNLLLISQIIQIKRTRHTGHCWKCTNEHISDVLLWTPAYGRNSDGRPVRIYLHQLRADTRCNLEDLPGAMNDKDGWWERMMVGWLFCFTVYQPFSGHLTPNQVILMKVYLFHGLSIFKYLFMVYSNFQMLIFLYSLVLLISYWLGL